MKKVLVIVCAVVLIAVFAVQFLGGELGRLLSEAFGADYTGTSRDLYHGNYIKYDLYTSGYQTLAQKYNKGELWYSSTDFYDSGHIVTNNDELAKLQKQITDQEIAPVDFDKYVLYVDTVRTAPTAKPADRNIRIAKVASFSANDDKVIVNKEPTSTIIKAGDGRSHVGYYQILKIKKTDFPFGKRNYETYDRDTKIDQDNDQIVYAE